MSEKWTFKDPAIVQGGRDIARVYCDNSNGGIEACRERGHLMAAAPDLLAALSDLAAYVDGYEYAASWAGRPHQIMDNARAAIAKTKGEA